MEAHYDLSEVPDPLDTGVQDGGEDHEDEEDFGFMEEMPDTGKATVTANSNGNNSAPAAPTCSAANPELCQAQPPHHFDSGHCWLLDHAAYRIARAALLPPPSGGKLSTSSHARHALAHDAATCMLQAAADRGCADMEMTMFLARATAKAGSNKRGERAETATRSSHCKEATLLLLSLAPDVVLSEDVVDVAGLDEILERELVRSLLFFPFCMM